MLEFFTETFNKTISENNLERVITFMAFRNREDVLSSRTPVQYYFELNADVNVLSIHKNIEIDLQKKFQ